MSFSVVKVCIPMRGMKACGVSGGIAAVILTLNANWQLHAPIALPQGKEIPSRFRYGDGWAPAPV